MDVSRSIGSCKSVDVVELSLFKAVIVARLILAADHRALGVDGAQHGFSVESGAPAILQSRHHPAAPAILFGQFDWYVIVPHQHYLKAAAAGFAGGAGGGLLGVASRYSHSVHSRILPDLCQI